MRSYLKILLPVLVLLAAVGVAGLLWATSPEADRNPEAAQATSVEVVEVTRVVPEVRVPVRGQVEALWTSELAAEVAGRVTEVHPQFTRGGMVKEGEILVAIDPADYQASLAAAQADLASAQLQLEQEQARAEQAGREWRELGQSGEPSRLTLREPQLANARVQVEAAEQRLSRARRDLERTEVRAPFDARIEQVGTERGSVLAAGTLVARVHPVDRFQIPLPVPVDQLAWIEVNEETEVRLGAALGDGRRTWEATLVRTAGSIDPGTRTMDLIAEIAADGAEADEGDSLVPGLFLNGWIAGRRGEPLVRVPRGALVDRDHVLVVDGDSTLGRRQIVVSWRDEAFVYVERGLEEGDRVVTTTLDNPVEGMRVEVVDSPVGES